MKLTKEPLLKKDIYDAIKEYKIKEYYIGCQIHYDEWWWVKITHKKFSKELDKYHDGLDFEDVKFEFDIEEKRLYIGGYIKSPY
jgi:hypothetical protein